MFTLFILLLIISIILLLMDHKSTALRWASAYAFLSGCGGLAVVFEENTAYFCQRFANFPIFSLALRFTGSFLASLFHYLAPYSLLMFALAYTEHIVSIPKKLKNGIHMVLLIPVILMYIIYPIKPDFNPSYQVLSACVALYVFAADTLLIYNCLKTKIPKERMQRFCICIIVIPATLFSLFTSFVLLAFDIHDTWRHNIWLIIFEFAIFICLAVRYGVFGIKLKFEKVQLDTAMRSMTSGTVILNHTIKNEITKIMMCAENIKHRVPIHGTELLDEINIISTSSEHMLKMTESISKHTRDFVINTSLNNADDIINQSIFMVMPLLKNKNISIIKDYTFDAMLMCDNIHITEALNNILTNAIEAIDNAGVIKIHLYKRRHSITIAVEDTGRGISKENLSHVVEPYFSTKKSYSNFGLGLSYCYNVMQKHGGSLQIESKANTGTTVFLEFPNKTMLKNKECTNE